MNEAQCHASGCTAPKRPEILMCFKHWRLVPRELQEPILAAYRARPATEETPSVDWCQAADAVVEFVAHKERRKVKQTFTATFHPNVRLKAPVERGSPTRVVNLRDEAYDVFIGRPGKDLDGPFGNPFRTGPVLTRFREYFLERVERDADFRAQVLALRGKRLGCFCKPKACHGDLIAEWVDAQPV